MITRCNSAEIRDFDRVGNALKRGFSTGISPRKFNLINPSICFLVEFFQKSKDISIEIV